MRNAPRRLLAAGVALTQVAVLLAATARAGDEATRLEAGRPVERRIAGGETHRFAIALEAGQALEAVVEQKGVDVTVALVDPTGRVVLAIDTPNGRRGPERVVAVAERGGDYALEVRTVDPSDRGGLYEARVEEARAATESDRTLAEAIRLAGQSYLLTRRLRGTGYIPAERAAYEVPLELAERAVPLYEAALGPEHPDTATALHILAETRRHLGRFAEAEPLLLRALAIREKTYGPEHLSVSQTLDALSRVYQRQGQFARAEALSLRAVAIMEKALGPEDPETAVALIVLTEIYAARGQYARAATLYERAHAVLEKALGPEHPDTANVLQNLAGLYLVQGHYAKVEPLYLRALAIKERALGPEHPEVAAAVGKLAGLYRDMGRYAKAEPLYLRSLAIYEKALGPEHAFTAGAESSLAALYVAQGRYEKAEPIFVRALAAREKTFGPEDPSTASALTRLALLHERQGRYAEAEPLHLRSLAVREKAHGPDHPDVARSLADLARCYRRQGEYAKAEPLFARALAIDERALGPEHPHTAVVLNELAILYTATAEYPRAVAAQARANEARERDLLRNLAAGSEAEKLAYLALSSGELDRTVSLHVRHAPSDPAAQRMALEVVLRRKGRALDAMARQVESLRRRAAPEDAALLDALAVARSALSRQTLAGPGRDGVEPYRARVTALERRVEELQKEIGQRSERFAVETAAVTLDAVRAALPEGARLMEFAAYRPYDPTAAEPYGEPRYVAYVLGRDGATAWADLGEAAPIDAAVAELRGALRDRTRTDVARRARFVDELVMRPVRERLGGATRLLVAPDGQLSLVPFDALVDERGRFATESYEISYLTSGRDLLRLAARVESREPAAVLANPDFGPSGAGASEARLLVMEEGTESATTAELLARARFGPLPGTAAEARALPRLLPGARVLTGAAASKEALTALSGPRVLHLATHGFFLASARPEAEVRDLELSPAPSRASSDAPPVAEDPLLRSGLALAGANLGPEGDGILTSLEAAGLDLWGTKLVVLSACDTGVGEVRNGDGVYGLRRALVLAGSETQVMSLWPVSDRGTRDLMLGYYRRLAKGEGRSAAMRAARLAMLRDPRRRHPYYWAGFIVSGEWASLDGTRRAGNFSRRR